MLQLDRVTKVYCAGTPDAKVALDDVSLTLSRGEFVTVIGANGAGKSTLLSAVAGDFLTDAGRICLDGEDVTLTPAHVRARTVGRLFQDPMRGTAPGMTVEENMALAAGGGGWLSTVTKKEKEAFRASLARLGMGLEDRMGQKAGSLSGGQRQALTLMMATYHPPKVLLLDEHTAALDPATAETVLDITRRVVAENRLTCLMITHSMTAALALGDRTLMMHRGRIILDAGGEERGRMSPADLLDRFKELAGEGALTDRMALE